MDTVSLVAEGWAANDVGHARSFRERWLGMKLWPNGGGLLLETRSVHGFGLRFPMRVVSITPGMRVSAVRSLRPGRILVFPTARFLLELPLEAAIPRVGSTVEIRHG